MLNADGTVEMDAAVMRGHDRAAGAVAGLRTFRHPIAVARAVMETTPHVFLAGEGAERFAAATGCEHASADWFATRHRLEQWRIQHARGATSLSEDNHFGTVGAVARDSSGSLAAATSTGGMTNKLPGRVGDAPVIGAGTWAENGTVAISATGHGEYFLRAGAAHAIHARIELLGESVDLAAEHVVGVQLRAIGGDGGLVAITSKGRAVWALNCAGMYRGVLFSDGTRSTAILSGDS